jgi:ring-1,2-phenylacetyl-CoA epoxidase subunit PaaE
VGIIRIKAVQNGVFSQFANSKLKAGDVLVGTPEGSLHLQIAKKITQPLLEAESLLSFNFKVGLKSEPKSTLFWYTETKHLKDIFINNCMT